MQWLDQHFGLENVISRAPRDFRSRVEIQWPASSPDLNPLDFNCWAHMKRLKNRQLPGAVAESRAEIISTVKRIWENDMTQDLINLTCGRGFKHRLERTLVAGGHSTESMAHLNNSRDSIGDLPMEFEEAQEEAPEEPQE